FNRGTIRALSRERDLDRYFTPAEVEMHNCPEDLWLSWGGWVYDLTALAEAYQGDPFLVPILRNAGKDISHWFDPQTGDVKTHVNPHTNTTTYYTPEGRFLHIPPPLPRADWVPPELDFETPWWMDREAYCIGRLSAKTRKIRIINTLTGDEHVLEVCSEEKISAIQDRYTSLNAHAKGYMWKRLGVFLNMSLTLEQNGIPDESAMFEKIGMEEADWLPAVHLYFSDDLTVA
ncbi:Cytochrome b5 domain-containing protein 1, partial [Quaeritorhiza haematococci]